jgi:hypothetical protein
MNLHNQIFATFGREGASPTFRFIMKYLIRGWVISRQEEPNMRGRSSFVVGLLVGTNNRLRTLMG